MISCGRCVLPLTVRLRESLLGGLIRPLRNFAALGYGDSSNIFKPPCPLLPAPITGTKVATKPQVPLAPLYRAGHSTRLSAPQTAVLERPPDQGRDLLPDLL